jgi:hypothetical protein
MKNAKVKLDIENAEAMGKTISLHLTSSGHYYVSLRKNITVEEVNAAKFTELSDGDVLF